MENIKYVVDGRDIHVFDNLFTSDIVFNMSYLNKQSSFKRIEFSKDPNKLFYSSEFDMKVFKTMAMYKIVVEKITELYGYEPVLNRTFINAQNFGDVSEIHIDSVEEGVTAIYYLNEIWDKDWGGETIFYEKDEPVVCVLPKSGRIVFADARISHVGRTPNRQCTETRYSFSMKFNKEIK